MSDIFQDLFAGGQPQRRDLKFRLTYDAQGRVVLQPLEGQVHIISPEDSLDTVHLAPDAFLDCGCSVKPNQPRYHCCEPGCPHVVCEQHIKYCHCGKGLCPQCQYSFEVSPGQPMPMCQTHYRDAVRRQRWARVARVALSPFIAFDKPTSPK